MHESDFKEPRAHWREPSLKTTIGITHEVLVYSTMHNNNSPSQDDISWLHFLMKFKHALGEFHVNLNLRECTDSKQRHSRSNFRSITQMTGNTFTHIRSTHITLRINVPYSG